MRFRAPCAAAATPSLRIPKVRFAKFRLGVPGREDTREHTSDAKEDGIPQRQGIRQAPHCPSLDPRIQRSAVSFIGSPPRLVRIRPAYPSDKVGRDLLS